MAVRLGGWASQGTSGTAISGATVEAYEVGGVSPVDTTTTNSSGYWEFTALADGDYDIKIINGSSIRWVRATIYMQVAKIVGLDGVTAPLADASIDASMLKSTVIPDYSVTADTATAVSSNTNAVDVWFGKILTILQALSGEDNWYDTPGTSIEDVIGDFEGHTHDGTDSPYISLSTTVSELSSTVSVLGTSWADGPSMSLDAGTYVFFAQVTLSNSATFGDSDSHVVSRIWNGTTVYGSGQATIFENSYNGISVFGYAALGSTTTVKISSREYDATTGVIHMQPADLGGDTSMGTRLIAVRIG